MPAAKGNAAYVIGANVSHQHVPKKKIVPNIQPRTNDFAVDAFPRSTAHISGTSANHARNQNSKSGNARISRTAARMASRAFFHDGQTFSMRATDFIAE